MPDLTPKGVPYANPADPNDLTLHTQGLADWIDANPGIAPMTTAQRDALTGTALWDGRVILNLTTGRLERYDAGATIWRSASVSDHGELAGLADDDHPQYLNILRHDTTARHGASVVDHGSIGGLGDDDHPQYVRHALATAKGDLLAATAAGVLARLGVGADGQILTADSATAAGMRWSGSETVVAGSYVGDGTTDRVIALPRPPAFVIVARSAGSGMYLSSLAPNEYGTKLQDGQVVQNNITAATIAPNLTANGFRISGSSFPSPNQTGQTFRYVALLL